MLRRVFLVAALTAACSDRTPEATPADAGSARAPGVQARGPFYRAETSQLASFALDELVASGGPLRLARGRPGNDPQPSGYHGGSFYNGRSYRFGTATSPEWRPAGTFDSVTPSFEASTPPGTWIEISLAASSGGTWSKDYSLGVWADNDTTIRRHSVDGQGDAAGDVKTDTLELTRPADALRVKVSLFSESSATPELRAISLVATLRSATPAVVSGDPAALGKVLAVPMRSQMIWPGGGEVWCSPTSTSMLLAYWADALGDPSLRETPPEAAGRCYDRVYDGTGNWPFNTAHAAALSGGRLHAAVTRLGSFAQVERLITVGVPVALSVRYDRGELRGAAAGSTDGHLIVARGFTPNGDVVCNDPAFGTDAAVQVTYDRAELDRAWRHSLGTTYLIWPASRPLPVDPAGAFY